ncbi:MAG: hypothetical protein ACREA0_17865, partial [bacterium]
MPKSKVKKRRTEPDELLLDAAGGARDDEETPDIGPGDEDVVRDGRVLDFISGTRTLKDTAK